MLLTWLHFIHFLLVKQRWYTVHRRFRAFETKIILQYKLSLQPWHTSEPKHGFQIDHHKGSKVLPTIIRAKKWMSEEPLLSSLGSVEMVWWSTRPAEGCCVPPLIHVSPTFNFPATKWTALNPIYPFRAIPLRCHCCLNQTSSVEANCYECIGLESRLSQFQGVLPLATLDIPNFPSIPAWPYPQEHE